MQTLINNNFQNQILVVDGDDFREKPFLVLQKIEKYLEVSSFFLDTHFDYTVRAGKSTENSDLWTLQNVRSGFPCFKLNENSESQCMGGNKGRDHPELNEESLKYLREYFKPILESFQKQTGMKIRLKWNCIIIIMYYFQYYFRHFGN